MEVWRRTRRTVRIVLAAIWASTLIYIAIVLLKIPSIPVKDDLQTAVLFYLFLSLAIAAWLASLFFLGRRMDEDHLKLTFEAAPDAEAGAASLASTMRVNPLVMAALGEASVVYGLVLYFISGDTRRPWALFIIGLLHLGWVWMRFSRTCAIVEQLLQDAHDG